MKNLIVIWIALLLGAALATSANATEAPAQIEATDVAR